MGQFQDLRSGELAAGQIAARFSISGPSISRHLTVLKGAGLVRERREANHIYYSLVEERLALCVGNFSGAPASTGGQPIEGEEAMKRLPTMVGTIDRRLLINYRVDPDVLARLLPEPFEPQVVRGAGLAGICLIRLSHLRPAGPRRPGGPSRACQPVQRDSSEQLRAGLLGAQTAAGI